MKDFESLISYYSDRDAWKKAAKNTLNCLIGCNIGDFGTIIVMQIYWPHVSMFLIMGLAMLMGLLTSILLEATILKFKEGFQWGVGIRMAFSMSFLSMLGMEFAENITDYFLTGGMMPPTEVWYWISLAIALIVGFLAPLPYNYYKFKTQGRLCCHGG
ncbi:MAG: hypothetical protein A3F89_05120 [Deltaproteobacteria bacterium RIFCSPLOWO2_12_FULL_50_11]|nr:MAG: hypothetical protein A3B79_02175 [Deltaproteobacteria bacterium RIFCSPHIGHO2_02_FULL_50_15]OGQ66795.1 MAG: hypothetical protein A3F89_05120 [Deltaproteobacteria bacterium RIFCSPLOWO2_12_FULL_50_11]